MTEHKRLNFDVPEQIPRFAIDQFVHGLHLGLQVRDGSFSNGIKFTLFK
jgi:hypothetical protein